MRNWESFTKALLFYKVPTVRSLLNAIKGCIRKLLRNTFYKLILVAKFLYVYDILILSFENNNFSSKLRNVENKLGLSWAKLSSRLACCSC